MTEILVSIVKKDNISILPTKTVKNVQMVKPMSDKSKPVNNFFISLKSPPSPKLT